jgi:transketolase C-terminal domain/subunit
VINLSSLHPLNESKLLELAQNFEMLVTVEDHSRHGGIGSKIGDILLKNNLSKKLIKIGLESTPESGKYEDILTKHGLSAKAIYENIRENWIKS